MNVAILLRLLFSHFLGDFLLQSDRLCAGKQKEGPEKYGYLAIHSAIMSVLAYLFVAKWGNWIVPTVVFVSHYLIDLEKEVYQRRHPKQKTIAFLTDQALHLLVLTLLWFFLFCPTSLAELADNLFTTDNNFWIYLISYIIVLRPTSIFLGLFVRKWTPEDSRDKSLPNAGKWIGYLERVLILTFIFTGNVEGVGFLLAAKSIFRFGELSKANDIRMTEYVLIGTFASFAIALLVGFAAVALL